MLVPPPPPYWLRQERRTEGTADQRGEKVSGGMEQGMGYRGTGNREGRGGIRERGREVKGKQKGNRQRGIQSASEKE